LKAKNGIRETFKVFSTDVSFCNVCEQLAIWHQEKAINTDITFFQAFGNKWRWVSVGEKVHNLRSCYHKQVKNNGDFFIAIAMERLSGLM
jgi:hypothetical protein